MKQTTIQDKEKLGYQLKHGWSFRKEFKEHPVGESQTVPDDSYTIQELIKKYASGLDPEISKLGQYNGEEDEVDFDDVDYANEVRQDIAEVTEKMREAAQRQATLLQQMEEAKAKKAVEKETDVEVEIDEAEERPESKNTSKSRKYEQPKKRTEDDQLAQTLS